MAMNSALGSAGVQLDQVIPLVLEHAEDASIPKTLCSLLQVSSTCRRAVQQSVGHCFTHWDWHNLSQMAEFAAWMPQHAGLVHGICLDFYLESTRINDMAQQLMASTLAACRCQCSAAAAEALPAHSMVPLATGVQPRQQPMVRSFKTYTSISPALCSALAACSSLTELRLLEYRAANATPAVCAALGTLTTLQRLEVYRRNEVMPACFAAAVAPLCHLTSIEGISLPASVLARLPVSLQDVQIEVRSDDGDQSFAAHLSSLTALLRLDLTAHGYMDRDSTLPGNLTALTVVGPVLAQPVGGLHQLHKLVVDHPLTCSSLLNGVALAQLQLVDVELDSWGSGEAREAVQAICSFASITRLVITGDTQMNMYGSGGGGWLLHEQLQLLPKLCELEIIDVNMRRSDAQGLTVLSGLKELYLCGADAVGDAGAVFLALNMPHLVYLGIVDCGLSSESLWPAVASCTNLRGLELSGDELKVTEEALLYLSRATQLTRLWLHNLHLGGQM